MSMSGDPFTTSEDLEELMAPPVVLASYPGECNGCGDRIQEGDRIQSDGQGGWLCPDCLVEGEGR